MPLHKSVVSKFLKAGATIEQTEHRGNITWYIATYGERFVAWYTEEGRARCLHTPSPNTDIITDCFCDRYYYTINDAVYSLVGHDKYQELTAKKEAKP